ncbi:hypothetical protein M758_UG066200 [Ceratodon purpureus]|nr:hypothetical protein M758_UG066200 [Ceratodon purpureus]
MRGGNHGGSEGQRLWKFHLELEFSALLVEIEWRWPLLRFVVLLLGVVRPFEGAGAVEGGGDLTCRRVVANTARGREFAGALKEGSALKEVSAVIVGVRLEDLV